MPQTAPTLEELKKKEVPGALSVVAGRNGQPALDIQTDACTGRLYLHGATLTDYQPTGHRPVLFTSGAAVFDGRKAIRGGVPVCFPWFSAHPTDPDAPAHGLVRTKPWRLITTAREGDAVTAELATNLDHLHTSYRVRFGDDLRLTFIAANTTDTPQRFELALHTYLAVGDIHRVTIAGLEGAGYLDNLQKQKRFRQDDEPIRFTEEFDRVYVDTEADCVLTDPVLERTIRVAKTGSASTVVWNPWTAKAARMADLGDEEWQQFCCIETGCIADNAIDLPPGGTHTVTVSIRAETPA